MNTSINNPNDAFQSFIIFAKNYEAVMRVAGAPESAFKTFNHMSSWCLIDLGYIAPENLDDRVRRNKNILHRAVINEAKEAEWATALCVESAA